MADANTIQTHWFGCWREHHDCAVAMVERAAELIGPTWFPSQADRDRKESWVAMLNGPAAVFRPIQDD